MDGHRKRATITVACVIAACVAVACIVVALLPARGRKPFADLDAADIASVQMTVTPPQDPVDIDDIPQLVEYLHDLVIYERKNIPDDSVGQYVQLTVDMKDGAQKVIGVYNPFLIIDGMEYRTEYEPCEAFNNYANTLLDAK